MKTVDIANYTVAEQLRDLRPVTIRAIRPGDKELLREAFKELEDRSIHMRFFGPKKELTDRELTQATEVDFVRTVALVCCIKEGDRERIIGGGRYIVCGESDPPSAAEIAFAVEEDYHGQGIASMLLKHLLRIARSQGIPQFEAEVLPSNGAMLRVFERAGLPVATSASSDSVHVTIFLNEGAASRSSPHKEPGSSPSSCGPPNLPQ